MAELNKELTREEKKELLEKNYLSDIDVCIKLLENLKSNFISPGTYRKINTSRVTRSRLLIQELLKKY